MWRRNAEIGAGHKLLNATSYWKRKIGIWHIPRSFPTDGLPTITSGDLLGRHMRCQTSRSRLLHVWNPKWHWQLLVRHESTRTTQQSLSWARWILSMPSNPTFYNTRIYFNIIIPSMPISGSRDNSVGIATGYGLDDRGVGVRVPVESSIFSSPSHPDRLWGPPNGYMGLFPRE
jgi:hypothetical protein